MLFHQCNGFVPVFHIKHFVRYCHNAMLLSGNLALLQDFKLFLIDFPTLHVFIPSETVCFGALCPAMLCVDACTSARHQRNEPKPTQTKPGHPKAKREGNDSSRNELSTL